MSLRVLIIGSSLERTALFEQALGDSGYKAVGRFASSDGLAGRVAALKPDVIVIDIVSPDPVTLENIRLVMQDDPRPIVMFAEQDDSASIQSAVRAGVGDYVVDGLGRKRIRPVMELAVARFREFQALRNELAEARNRLAERKHIDRAKGLLIEKYKMTEEEAYAALRKMAMNRNQRIAEVSLNVIAMMETLAQ